MAFGPGKYGDECEAMLHRFGATGVILMVLGTVEISGFSVSLIHPGLAQLLPGMLREMATQIEADTGSTS